MVHFKKPKTLFVACLVVLVVTPLMVILVLVSMRKNHKPKALDFNKPAQDSFFLKSAPLSGPVKLLMGDSVVYPAKLDIGRLFIDGPVYFGKPSERRLQFIKSRQDWKDSAFFTVIVPFDKKYRLILTDSTEIVIQGGSTLRFPRTFNYSEKSVELNGCAFFTIAHNDPRPFIVKTPRLKTTTGAARFAVQYYLIDSLQSVNVLSGVVVVTSDTLHVTATAKGGQMIKASPDYIYTTTANRNDSLYWKDEYFEFDGLNMRQGLTKIADAYRMHIIFKGQIREGPFGSGLIQTDLPLRDLLTDLELPDLHFEVRMRDSTIVVKGK